MACDSGAGGDAGSGAGGGGGGEGGVFASAGWATLRTQFGDITYHSGFDGTNVYQVPLAFVGSAEPQFSVADSGVASIITTIPVDDPRIPEGLTVRAVLLRTNGVGSTAVTATVGGDSFPATLVVNAYTPADVVLGDERYNAPANADATGRRSCNSCHATLAKHSTGLMADLTDEEIINTAVNGIGVELRDPGTGQTTEYQPNDGIHTWNVTPAEEVGITAYLRSRSPLYQLPNL